MNDAPISLKSVLRTPCRVAGRKPREVCPIDALLMDSRDERRFRERYSSKVQPRIILGVQSDGSVAEFPLVWCVSLPAPDGVKGLRNRLKEDTHVGGGLHSRPASKFFVFVPVTAGDLESAAACWEAIAAYFRVNYGIAAGRELTPILVPDPDAWHRTCGSCIAFTGVKPAEATATPTAADPAPEQKTRAAAAPAAGQLSSGERPAKPKANRRKAGIVDIGSNLPKGGTGLDPFIPTWLDDARLSPYDLRVLLNLWRRRNPKTGQCNPKADTIASDCGIDRKTVWAAIKRVEATGYLTRQKPFGGSNQYFLGVPSIVPPVGTIDGDQLSQPTGRQLSQPTGRQLSQPTGRQLSQPTGREGSPLKDPHTREGASAPAHLPFTLPSLEQWLAYADKIQWSRPDSENAFDNYLTNGWLQKSGNKVVDWRAAARGCKRMNFTGRGPSAAAHVDPPLRMISP